MNVWYIHTRGYIIKYWYDENNKIMREKIPYNQPNHFDLFLNNYFKNQLK
jgi:hypothetical protein